MSRLFLRFALLTVFVGLVPKPTETACIGLTPSECKALRNDNPPFRKSMSPSSQVRGFDLNKLDDDTLKRALDLLLAEKATEEFEVEKEAPKEMTKHLEEEDERRSQYERIRELLDKLLKE